MKKEFKIKERVWIHIGDRKLTEGRVVEIIDLDHLNEGYGKDNELYIVEIPTEIEPIYEVRSFGQISPDSKGPIHAYRNLNVIKAQKYLGKVGFTLPVDMPNPLAELAEEINQDLNSDMDEPTPEQIHAAMERAERVNVDTFRPPAPQVKKSRQPRRPYSKRKKHDS
jgi:hypothetical protein